MHPTLLAAVALVAGWGLRPLWELFQRPGAEEGLADLLLYGIPIAPGLLLNKNGSLTLAWKLRGPDYTSSTSSELVNLGRVLHQSLLPFRDHYLLNFDVLRVPAGEYAPAGDFPDPLSRAMDEERRRAYEASERNFVTETFLTLTYEPPREVYHRAAKLFIEEAEPTETTPWHEHLRHFLATVEAFEVRLATVIELERLGTDALGAHLRSCLLGSRQTLRLPSELDCDLAYYLSAEDLVGGFEPRIGERHVRVVSVRGFPHLPALDAFEPFHEVPFPCRSSHRLYVLGRQRGRRLLASQRQAWFRRVQGLQGEAAASGELARKVFSSAGAAELAVDAAQALDELEGGETLYASYVWSLVVTDADKAEVERKAAHLAELWSARGFAAASEYVNTLPAFLGSLPAHGRWNLRRPILSLRSIADLLPTTSPWLGHPSCPSSLFPPKSPPAFWALTGDRSTPYRFNLHHRSVPHGLVLGRTRSGKSVFLGTLALQCLRWPNSRVYLFDQDYSAAFTVLAAQGHHYPLSPEAPEIQFQPLARLDAPGERAWAAEWIETLLRLQSFAVTASVSAKIERALELLAQDRDTAERTLTLFSSYVDDLAIRQALRLYTREGRYGALLDASSDGLLTGRLQAFEMGELLSASELIALPVLLYLFHRIESSIRSHEPVVILIDEAWKALLHEVWAQKISDWLRRLAKMNAGVWLSTHTAEDIVRSPFGRLILDSCPSRVHLPDPRAKDPDAEKLYRSLGLNEREIELLSHAEERRHYLHRTPTRSRLIELALGPLALAALTPRPGRTVHEMYREALALRHELGLDWFAVYLERHGIAADPRELCRATPAQDETAAQNREPSRPISEPSASSGAT